MKTHRALVSLDLNSRSRQMSGFSHSDESTAAVMGSRGSVINKENLQMPDNDTGPFKAIRRF